MAMPAALRCLPHCYGEKFRDDLGPEERSCESHREQAELIHRGVSNSLSSSRTCRPGVTQRAADVTLL